MSTTGKPATQVVTGELHRVRRGHRKGFSAEPEHEPSPRPARIAVTLALAHMIRRAIDRGEIRDQAGAAKQLGVTRARMTQMIALTFLAPDLQEEILCPLALTRRVRAKSNRLRSVVNAPWVEQRAALRAGETLRSR